MKRYSTTLLYCAAMICSVAPASATILVDQASAFAPPFSIGGAGWDNFTASLGAQPGGYALGSIADAGQLASASAILVVHRAPHSVLSSVEQTNLTSFLATGKRVLLLGENAFVEDWNNSIIGFASGGKSMFAETIFGNAKPTLTNSLTAGVTISFLAAAGTNTVGGKTLFNRRFATLWRSNQNLLTVLDSNLFDDIGGGSNPRFAQNVANWLGGAPLQSVPEPATWGMMLLGFALVGHMMRRRAPNASYPAYGLRTGGSAASQNTTLTRLNS